MSTLLMWQHAYARQARADFAAYEVLRVATHLPQCESLHFLQMACEKLCKSYLCSRKVEPRFLQTSHGFIASHLPEIFKDQRRRLKLHPLNPRSALVRQVNNLSREIELLAPTVDSQRRPDNCEYPWLDGAGEAVVPAEYPFANLSLLSESAGQDLLKIIPSAIDELL